jgi:S1-C subfamily serine protease
MSTEANMLPRLSRSIALLVTITILATAGPACGSEGQPEPQETPGSVAGTPSPTVGVEQTETPPQGPSTLDLAQATVQIWALSLVGDSFEPVWTGSGTIISEDGLVMTNAHVVDERYGEYDRLAVAVLTRTDQPPEIAYLAEVAAVDYALDLAVIRIVSDLEGIPLEVDLPTAEVGDSDDVEIGDHIRILGYPGIGGETITFTGGVVSGFASERGLTGHAWIKTDATIAGGNSGGMAINDQGQLVGVPTIVGSTSNAEEYVDCRYVADTNRDGEINDLDSCVPVGGFINGLRPVNLALPLVQAAETGEEYVGSLPVEPEPTGGFDTSQVVFRNLVFADGVTADDRPTQIVEGVPAGTTRVCAFWDYEGMVDAMTWEAMWFIDTQVNEEGSIIDNTWTGGGAGNWWVCTSDDGGLPDGLYEVVLSVEGEVQQSGAVFVGGSHPPVDFTIVNESSGEICFAFISPDGAQNWGADDLGGEELIERGASRTWLLPASTYDLLLEDCDGQTLAEEYGLDLAQSPVFTLTD